VAGGGFYPVGAIIDSSAPAEPVPGVFGYHEVFHACTVVGGPARRRRHPLGPTPGLSESTGQKRGGFVRLRLMGHRRCKGADLSPSARFGHVQRMIRSFDEALDRRVGRL
jgi:hypothetical protein